MSKQVCIFDVISDFSEAIHSLCRLAHAAFVSVCCHNSSCCKVGIFFDTVFMHNLFAGSPTLTAREIQTAVRLLIPGEIKEHAVSEGRKAVMRAVNHE